ncbi:hypothetical protein BD408DRAFT_377230 [Parasitella parasitica]|nr:hypothetical protein BD408DRAFT_377230 [Parasitella parasitica]
MLQKTVLFSLTTIVSIAAASSFSPRGHTYPTISDRLSRKGIDGDQIGCKCIMSSPTKQNTDSTNCMCINRADGSVNESDICSPYIDTIYSFCSDVTNNGSLYQKCLGHYCPATGATKTPPKYIPWF